MPRVLPLTPLLLPLLVLGACDGCGDSTLTPFEIAPPLVPEVVDFGEVLLGARSTEEVVLRAAPGTEPPLLESVTVSGPFGLQRIAPLPTHIDPALALVLRFEPAVEGPAAGVLRLTTDAASAPVEVPLIGRGTPPPLCEDLGPCRAVHFDIGAGACVQTLLEGGCDDADACTVGDLCVNGSCVGAAVACGTPAVACYVGRCDADAGCVAEPADTLCDDDDPCTVDRCVATGCENTLADDGTPCGPPSCATLALCFAGLCEESPTPAGFPCDDDDVCTSGDQCQAGTCGGTPFMGGGGIVDAEWTYGAARATAVRVGDAIVVRDVYDTDGTGLMTVLQEHEGALTLHHRRLELDGRGFTTAIAPVGEGHFGVFHIDGTLELFALDPTSQAITPAGSVELEAGDPPSAVTHLLSADGQSVLAAFANRSELHLLYGLPGQGTPVTPTSIPLPSTPRDLDDDTQGWVYAALNDGSLVRLYLYTGAFPPPTMVVRQASDSLVSATPGMLAAARPDDVGFLSGPRVVDLLGEGDALVGSVAPLEGQSGFALIGDIDLHEGRLAVLLETKVQLYDVSAPASPTLLAEAAHLGGTSYLASGALHLDGELLILSSRTLYGSGLRLFDVRDDTLEEIHLGEGSILEMVDVSPHLPRTLGLHRHALFGFNPLEDDVGLAFAAHARPAGGDVVYRVLTPEGAFAWPLGSRPGGAFTGYGDLPVVTVNLSGLGVVETGAWTAPFAPGVLSVVSDGVLAHAVRMSNDDEAFFDVYDLAAATEAGPLLVTSLPLELLGADRNNFTGLTRHAGRIAAFMEHDWDFDTPLGELRSSVLLLDVAAPAAPVEVARTTVSGLVRGVRPAGEAVYGILRGSGWYNTDYEGEQLFRLDRMGSALVDGDIVAIERASRVLWAEAGRVVVATEEGVAFFKDDEAGLAPVSTLALPAPPTHALPLENRLLLATPLGAVLVELPCP